VPINGKIALQQDSIARYLGFWFRQAMSKTSIHLITPLITNPADFSGKLQTAISATAAASVHLRFKVTNDQDVKRFAQALAPLVQNAGAALIIDPPSDLREVARWGADGVHVTQAEALQPALEALKPDRIVGVGGLRSKDAAMNAGEAGCDYLLFGEPRADGSLPPLEQVLDRCQWWAEVFNTPCIGYAADMASIAPLAKTGVEFIALGDWAFEGSAADITARLSEVKALLKA
jgi:thiamine-phosphate pyrophosphorylase